MTAEALTPSGAAAGSRRIAEIASVCGGRVVGDPGLLVRAVRSLEAAGPDELAFVADARAMRKAAGSRAGCLLARSAKGLEGRTVIEVRDPALALAEVLPLFFAGRKPHAGVHPTAIVAPGAEVDPSAEIGPYVVVGAGSRVGAGTIVEAHAVIGELCRIGQAARLHPHVVLYDGVVVGDRTEVHSGAVLGADGFGFAPTSEGIRKIPQVGRVEIGEDVEIGANSCVDRASLEVTRVGAGTKIDDLVMIGHNCEVGRHGFLCGQVGLAGSSIVGDGVVLGGQVGVAGHLTIGDGVKVGAQSGVSGDVPDGANVNGSPHMDYKDSLRAIVELRRLPETARLVRTLAARAGIPAAKEGSE